MSAVTARGGDFHKNIFGFGSSNVPARLEQNGKFLTFAALYIRSMKIKEVAAALERFAPLPLQEDYDNAGLQVGLTETEASGALLCLDVTEETVREAVRRGCNVLVAHHPLLFRGLKCVSAATEVERCVREAILYGITIYAAHTNLDNAPGGVNHRIAEKIGLEEVKFLQPFTRSGFEGGSGVIGVLPKPEAPLEFLHRVAEIFGVECLMHNEGPKEQQVQRVALCGGSGDFLLGEAVRQGADVFLTGEMGYHHYFGHASDLWLGVLGHYQSERFTLSLMRDVLAQALPELPVFLATQPTNPIRYMHLPEMAAQNQKEQQ